jgi:two-component system response regulator AtoC
MDYRIIVIDDEGDFLDSVRRGFITAGYRNVTVERDPHRAAERFQGGESFDIALIDVTMPALDGVELLEIVKRNTTETECNMETALDEARLAVKCLRKGAYDYLVKPVSKEDLISSVERALERRRLFDLLDLGKKGRAPALRNSEAFKPILTRSESMRRVLKEAELHAASDVPVLITGETGTGKDLLARAVHAASRRAKEVFIPVNMDAMPAPLFDAAFFGHTKGAFTGADSERPGFLEHANRGTIFMDEVGSLPLEMQGRLLRVLQEGEFIKIGTNHPQKTDVRFIAATNKDLDVLVAKNQFRKDLYYRLRGGWLHLPPLKQRREDIPLLISRFIEEIHGSNGIDLAEEAVALLLHHDYPGNVRELRSIVHSAINLAQGKKITPACLPEHLRKKSTRPDDPIFSFVIKPLAQMEKDYILKVYEETGRNKTQTALLMEISLNTLRRKLESYGVT